MPKKNTGGRKIFDCGEARILQLDGKISDKVYIIRPEDNRSDSSGNLEILEKESGKVVKVHHRRILPLEAFGCAAAFGDQNRAVCPKCGRLFIPSEDGINCPDDGFFTLYWIGEKPMTATKDEKKEKAPKVTKVVQEPIKIDLDQLLALENCELWIKPVKFDHPGLDVNAYVLLNLDEDEPRKLCFNSYDGTLGKKGKPLPIEAFMSGHQKANIFGVKDIVKERTKLVNNGYEQLTKEG